MEREGRWKGDDWRPKGWSERLDWELPVPTETKKEKSSTKTFSSYFSIPRYTAASTIK